MRISNPFQRKPKTEPPQTPKASGAMLKALAVAGACPVWLIRDDRLSLLQGVLSYWWDDDDEETESAEYEVTESGVAIIPIHGTMVDAEPEYWWKWYGYCSTPQVRRWVEAATADANVKSILLHLNSPGGQAYGVADLSDAVFAVRGAKPIVAFAKDACSAAYFVGCQAERLYVSQDGYTGCIGSLSLVYDWSGMYAEMGVTVYRLTSDGAEVYKGQGARGTELLPEQQTDIKRVCNEHQSLFNAAISRGRNLTATVADGRYHVGQSGVTLGLADRVATLEEVLSALGAGRVDIEEGSTEPVNPPEGDAPNDNQPAPTQDRGGTKPMNAWEWLQSKLQGEQAPTETTPAAQPQPGQMTTAERQELERLRAAEQARATQEAATLEARREQLRQAAVRAFGDNAERIAQANEAINGATNMAALAFIETTLVAQTPTALRTPGRITTSPNLTESSAVAGGDMGSMMATAAKRIGDSRQQRNGASRNGGN